MSALYIASGRASALPLHILLSAIPSLPRHALNALVDRAIERMDLDDGDADVEDDDPGGGAADDVGEVDEETDRSAYRMECTDLRLS